MVYKYLLCTLYLLFCTTGFAQQNQWHRQDHSQASLQASHDALVPGKTINLLLWVKLDPHWHSYWRNPGDSASTADLVFNLPQGYTSKEVFYPLPQRIPTGPLMSFGYEQQMLLSKEISIPLSENEFIGSSRTIKLAAEWLVCKVECIPAIVDFQITLPIRNKAQTTAVHKIITTAKKTISPKQIEARYIVKDNQLELRAQLPKGLFLKDSFPYPGTPSSNNKPIVSQISEQEVQVLHEFDPTSTSRTDSFQFLWTLAKEKQAPQGYLVQASPTRSPVWKMVLFALLGGLILNLMPCVLPILTLKLFGFIEMAKDNKKSLIQSQLSYLMGILCSLWALSSLIILMRNFGQMVGWGFQLQYPPFVAFLVWLFFIMGLSFIGVFEVNGKFVSLGDQLTRKPGLTGSFFTGVLAVIVASPCTAPFMGVAIGFALSQTWVESFMVFSSLGIGLGAPYLLAAFFPKIVHYLPKPGAWMVIFKEVMAFPLWATSIWLLWVLNHQLSQDSLALILSSLLLVSLTLWCFNKIRGRWKSLCLIIGLGISLYTLYFATIQGQVKTPHNDQTDQYWNYIEASSLSSINTDQQAIFINFTAAWCITCQVNEKTTFSDQKVRQYTQENNIKMLKVDWTNRDPKIAQFLQQYGRAGVPLYLYYPLGQTEAKILPEVLSPELFIEQTQ